MASTCPNCGRRLRWYDIKAECKDCGVSIPNFNWEARLEEDNRLSEEKFAKFYRTLNMFAYSIWGTKLRIVRIILSFLPAIGFILPWGALKSDGESVGYDLIGIFTDGKSLIDFFKSFFGNINLFFDNMAFESYGGTVTFSMLALLFMLLSVIFIVIAFFMILFTNKHPKSKLMVIFDALSIVCAIAFAVCFTIGAKAAPAAVGFNFGEFPMYNATGGVMWGLYVYLGLLCVAFTANLLVQRAPAKSHEELEEERLARKAEKERKEAERQAEKEIEREKAEKAAAEEQKRIVEEARAKLEADKVKKNKKEN